MIRTENWLLRLIYGCCVLLAAAGCVQAGEGKGPGKLELGGAEHRLKRFEEKVARMRGQPFKLRYVEQEALRRIRALYKKDPDHPKTKELFERARKALVASKGETVEVKKEWLAYRETEKRLKQLFAAEAEKGWQAFKHKALSGDKLIAKAFPPPSHRDVTVDEMTGKLVVLENFEYPSNEFSDLGRQFCFVGSGARGYYYVELSSRSWLGAYEAVKCYRRFVCRDMPEGMKWTLVGKITGLELLVPAAGKSRKNLAAHWGWRVEPVAIRVPERTFAVADPQLELGGKFAGEDRMEEVKGPLYTVRKIPPNVTPERLVEIFVAAIQDKNYKLYLECVDPRRTKTPKGRGLCMYHWEWHQHRFATFYCHVEANKAKIIVVQGFDADSSLEGAFLTKEDIEKIKKHAKPLIKQAHLTTVAYDERGRQYGSPKPRYLRKEEKGHWYIVNYPQPF